MLLIHSLPVHKLLHLLRLNLRAPMKPIAPLVRTLCLWLTQERGLQRILEARVTDALSMLRTLEDLALLAFAIGQLKIQREISESLCAVFPKIKHPRGLCSPRELTQLERQKKTPDVYSILTAMKNSPSEAKQYLLSVMEAYEQQNKQTLVHLCAALGLHSSFIIDSFDNREAGMFWTARLAQNELEAEFEQIQYHLLPYNRLDFVAFQHDLFRAGRSPLSLFARAWSKAVIALQVPVYVEVVIQQRVRWLSDGLFERSENDSQPLTSGYVVPFEELLDALHLNVPGAKLSSVVWAFRHSSSKIAFERAFSVANDTTVSESERGDAARFLALYYYTGHGCDRDPALSKKWFAFAAPEWLGDTLPAMFDAGERLCKFEAKHNLSRECVFSVRTVWLCSIYYGRTITHPCALCMNIAVMRCPCETQRYCSAKCQQLHWPEHKANCIAKKKAGETIASPSPSV